MMPAIDIVSGIEPEPHLRGGRRRWPAPMGPVEGDGARPSVTRAANNTLAVDLSTDHLLVALPLTAAMALSFGDNSVVVPLGTAAIISHHGHVQVSQSRTTEMVLASVGRARFQAWVGVVFEEPRRLRRAATAFRRDAACVQAAVNLAAAPSTDASIQQLEDDLCLSLIGALSKASAPDEIWATHCPLKRAANYILDNLDADCSPETLARRFGTTPKTLQRQAAAFLGAPLAAFVSDVRMTAAHRRLTSVYESRSIDEMAREYRFASSSTFTRAYRRRFGETPTQTRTKAVRGP